MAASTSQALFNALPGSDRAGIAGALAEALRSYSMDDDNMVPARVVTFDRTKNLVTVQPLIKWIGMDDKSYSRWQIADLNCISIGGGGFHVSFPIKEGDLGWIIASDRDLSLFKETLEESNPNTLRFHNFADALFVPDVFRKYTINAGEADAMVIQSTDSATRIAIFDDQVHITAPTMLKVVTPLSEFSQDVHIKGSLVVDQNAQVKGNLTVDQNTTVTGALAANGGFTAAGGQPCTLPATTTVAGKTVNGHVHVDPQGGSTGPF